MPYAPALSSSSVAAWLASSSLAEPRRCRGVHRLGNAALIEPGFALGVQVDAAQGLAEVVPEQDIAEAFAVACAQVIEAAQGVLPAHRNELVDEGLFDFDVFRTVHVNCTVKS